MISILMENNYLIDKDTPANICQEWYDIYLDSLVIQDKRTERFKFPVHAAKPLHNKSVLGTEVMEFELIDGGKFIQEKDKLLDRDILLLLELMSAFVCINPGYSHCDFDKGLFDVMPSLFVDVADGSRVDSGCRLLERCL